MHGDGIGTGPVPDGRAGQHPDPVRGPLFKLVKRDTGTVVFDLAGLAVRPVRLHELYLVVDDVAVATVDGRRVPRHPDGGGTYRLTNDIGGWGTRYYGGV